MLICMTRHYDCHIHDSILGCRVFFPKSKNVLKRRVRDLGSKYFNRVEHSGRVERVK